MMLFARGFLEDLTRRGGNDGIRGEDERGFRGVVDVGGVDVATFGFGGEEDVLKGGEGFGLVFGEGGRVDFEGGETDLYYMHL